MNREPPGERRAVARHGAADSIPALRAAIGEALSLNPRPQTPPSWELLGSHRHDRFTRHRIRYTARDGDVIPAFLAIPDGTPPFAAVAVFHQHNGQRHLGKSEVFGLAGDEYQAFGPALAKAGCVVLAPDSICFEDRRDGTTGTEPHGADFDQHYNELAYRLVYGDSLGRKVIADAADAINVLTAIPEVDNDRIGAVGHSYGGNTVLFLTAVDTQVRFAVASGAACTYRRKVQDGTGIEMAEVIPGFAAKFDIDDLVRACAPRPVLLVSGHHDKYAADADEIAASAFESYMVGGGADSLTHVRSGTGHPLDTERFDTIIEWAVARTRRSTGTP